MRHLLTPLLVVLTMTIAAACGSDDPTAATAQPTAEPIAQPTADPTEAPATAAPEPTAAQDEPAATAPPASDATAAPAAADATIDWNDPGRVAKLGGNWTIAKCDGEAPFICVARDGTVVATLEMARYPLASFTIMDPGADLATNIRAMADDFLAVIRADRTATCGSDYVFEPLDFEDFSFGDQPAYHYGYRATLADGTPSELNLQYATIVDGEIVLVTAIAYDEGGCPGRDDQSGFDTPLLVELQDEIEAVLRSSPLPST